MREYDVRNATLYFYVQQPVNDIQQSIYQFDAQVYRYLDGSQVNSDPLINKPFKVIFHEQCDLSKIKMHRPIFWFNLARITKWSLDSAEHNRSSPPVGKVAE